MMMGTSTGATNLLAFFVATATVCLLLGNSTVMAFAQGSGWKKARQDEDEYPSISQSRLGRRQRRRTLEDQMKENGGSITLHPIGVVRSVYSLCVGTPRQGLLAPDARGVIDFSHDGDHPSGIFASSAVQGLAEYSHIWIVFVFHLNTAGTKNKVPSKIAPPALGGSKVGVYATRSPHRPNPIGITLAKLDAIVTERSNCDNISSLENNNSTMYEQDKETQVSHREKTAKKKKPRLVTRLYISGLDLVDGTPVLDIKPYVPVYDTVQPTTDCRLPSWVAQGLQSRRTVSYTEQALSELQQILTERGTLALSFYGDHRNETVDQAMERVKACITQVLAIDVRSTWQTEKARRGEFQAQRASRIADQNNVTTATMAPDDSPHDNDSVSTQQIDNLLIYYKIVEPDQQKRVESAGSGAEDIVTVTSIQYMPQSKTNN